MGQTNNTEH